MFKCVLNRTILVTVVQITTLPGQFKGIGFQVDEQLAAISQKRRKERLGTQQVAGLTVSTS